jgi:hypothetical protein
MTNTTAWGALRDLWKSERGLVAIALIAACTVLVFTGRLTVERWGEYTWGIFLIYAGAKTITSTASIIKSAPPQPPQTTPVEGALVSMIEGLGKQIPTPPPIPAREPQAGRVAASTAVMLGIVMLGLAVLTTTPSCRPVKNVVNAGATAVVECAKADARPILELVAEIGTQAALSALRLGAIDWSGIEAAAIAQGKVTGGCALARFVAELQAAPRPAVVGLLAPPDPADDAAAALARVSARFDGATWSVQ